MRSKLTLDLNTLTVESFEPVQAAEAPENLTTCQFTNCGNKLCCA